MILIAVIASIMVMDPYVLRGVNAYMRSWEISAQEARHDIGQEVPAWIIENPANPPPLNCSDFDDNPSNCHVYGCNWLTYYRPAACNPENSCKSDDQIAQLGGCDWSHGNLCCIAEAGCPFGCAH